MTREAAEAWSSGERYDAFMGRWSRLLATVVVDWIGAPEGLRWLDVGCGTGALSEALLAIASPASLVGIDPSAAYVGIAGGRLADSRAAFHVGDAASLPLPDGSVDRAVSGLVLNFVPDPVAAVREMRRVLAPGGIASAYVWDYVDGMQMLRSFWDAAIAEDPAAAALDESARFPLCLPGGLERCFADAGLTDVVSQPVQIPTVFSDFDDYWEPFLGGQGPGPGYVVSLDDAARERLRARLQRTLPTGSDGSITLVARAWVASGSSA